MDLPQGYTSRPPTLEDAVAVAGLMAACVRADGGAEGTSVEHVLDDWREVDIGEEAVLVLAPDATVAGYADVVNRAYVVLTVYATSTPGTGGAGSGLGSSVGARAGCWNGCASRRRGPKSWSGTT